MVRNRVVNLSRPDHQLISRPTQQCEDASRESVGAQLWLRRVHDIRVAMGTGQRIFRDLGLPRLRHTRKRVPRQMKLFEKAEPGKASRLAGSS